MHSHRRNWVCPAVLLVIWMAGGVFAPAYAMDEQQQSAAGGIPPSEIVVTSGPSSYITGTVVSSSSEELVVRDSNGRTMDFALDQHRGYGAAMIPGDQVRVEYGAFDDQTDVAKNVETLGLLAVLGEEGGGTHAASEPTAAGGEPAAEPSQSAEASPIGGSSEQMPATASPLPVAIAAGVFLFAAGMGVRLFSRG